MEEQTTTRQQEEQQTQGQSTQQIQPTELESKISEYQGATTTKLASDANQTGNPHRTIAAYFYIYKKIEEEKKSKKPDWKNLYEKTLATYFDIAKDPRNTFGFNSATALLQAWLAAQIGGQDQLVSELFAEAKKAELVHAQPYSKGWVHYISAMSSPISNAGDFTIATEKGFDFNALIQHSFSQQFDTLIEKGIQTGSKRKGTLSAKQETTAVNFIKDNYDPFNAIKFENANNAATDYFQSMLLLSQNDIENGIPTVHKAFQNNYQGHSHIATKFWEAAFSRNWQDTRNQLLDVLLTYNRVASKKEARMNLRNDMINEIKTIDANKQSSDEQKIKQLKEKLLPLALTLAGTGLSAGQKAAIGMGSPSKGLSKLSLDVLKILFQQGEISADDIDNASLDEPYEGFDPKLAKKGATQWLKEVKKEQEKQHKDQKLYNQISSFLPKQNPNQATPVHPLSDILNLEVGANFDVTAFKRAIDTYANQGFNFKLLLENLRQQEDAKKNKIKNVFATFAKNGSLAQGVSFTLFSFLRLTDPLTTDLSEKENSRICGYYWLGVVLLSKGQTEDGLRLLAEAYLRNSDNKDPSRVAVNFDLIDQGEIMSKLFNALSWKQMLANLQGKAAKYAGEHTKEGIEKPKVKKKEPVNELRAEVANGIKQIIALTPSDTTSNKITADQIIQTKQTLLFKVIELMSVGYTSSLQESNLKSPINAVVFANMSELAKDVLDQLVIQLNLTPQEINDWCKIDGQSPISSYQFEYINDTYIASVIPQKSKEQSIASKISTGESNINEEEESITPSVSKISSQTFDNLQPKEQARVRDAISVCLKFVTAQREAVYPKDHALLQTTAPTRMERTVSRENVLQLTKTMKTLTQQQQGGNNNNNQFIVLMPTSPPSLRKSQEEGEN